VIAVDAKKHPRKSKRLKVLDVATDLLKPGCESDECIMILRDLYPQ
jgi:hypothetical protein